MSGKKGMKQRPPTPEERKLAEEASARGGAAAHGNADAPDPSRGNPLHATLVTLDDHDARLGLPVTWSESIKRQQVIGVQLANDVARLAIEAKRTEIDKERKRLFTVEQVREREHDLNALIFSHLAGVADLCAGLVEPHQKDDAKKKGREWISKVRNAVAEAIGKPDA